ncbi:MAG: GYD domain-containing protein [Dehalococcoidia bacterium]|nr:GYD domain-containing protein [Dehalococcoidia bacterium]
MAMYLMLTKLTERGRKRIMDHPERIKEVNKEVEDMGVEIVSQYFLMGPYDFVNIIRADDNWNATQVAMELASRGTLETMTLPAMEIDSFISYMSAMKHARRKQE